jgi:hypothetical protein
MNHSNTRNTKTLNFIYYSSLTFVGGVQLQKGMILTSVKSTVQMFPMFNMIWLRSNDKMDGPAYIHEGRWRTEMID